MQMQDQQFETLIESANSHPFSGWDFSYLRGRWQEEEPSWNYDQLVDQRIRQVNSLLDMGTGGGEFLASLAPLPALTYATESWLPNIPIARQRLEPLNVRVLPLESDDAVPMVDESVELVINRHESFDASEVHRILKPGGSFITQQVGPHDNIQLNEWITGQIPCINWTLEHETQKLIDTGLQIVNAQETFPETRFYDIGAVVYYLKVISWQIEGFTVDAYRDTLYQLHQNIVNNGFIRVQSHRYLIEVIKP
jgi:SAM-dependent methyltransferase